MVDTGTGLVTNHRATRSRGFASGVTHGAHPDRHTVIPRTRASTNGNTPCCRTATTQRHRRTAPNGDGIRDSCVCSRTEGSGSDCSICHIAKCSAVSCSSCPICGIVTRPEGNCRGGCGITKVPILTGVLRHCIRRPAHPTACNQHSGSQRHGRLAAFAPGLCQLRHGNPCTQRLVPDTAI